MAVEETYLPEELNQKGVRMATLEHVINKRVATLTYLKKVFGQSLSDGDDKAVFWMNVVRLTRADLDAHFAGVDALGKDRLYNWFCLGLSLAGLLSLPNGLHFVGAVSTLISEWEYFSASGVERMLKDIRSGRRKKSTFDGRDSLQPPPSVQQQPGGSAAEAASPLCPDGDVPNPPASSGAAAAPAKPPASPGNEQPAASEGGGGATAASTAHSGGAVYRHLTLPSVPTALCYSETVLCLSDVLIFVYRKLLDNECASEAGTKSVMDLDKKFKHHFFGLLSREVEKIAEQQVRMSQKALAARMLVSRCFFLVSHSIFYVLPPKTHTHTNTQLKTVFEGLTGDTSLAAAPKEKGGGAPKTPWVGFGGTAGATAAESKAQASGGGVDAAGDVFESGADGADAPDSGSDDEDEAVSPVFPPVVVTAAGVPQTTPTSQP